MSKAACSCFRVCMNHVHFVYLSLFQLLLSITLYIAPEYGQNNSSLARKLDHIFDHIFNVNVVVCPCLSLIFSKAVRLIQPIKKKCIKKKKQFNIQRHVIVPKRNFSSQYENIALIQVD